MDPYIEDPDIWPDFHADLASQIRTELNRRIQPRYIAKIIPRVTYEILEIMETRGVTPDVAVWRTAREAQAAYPAAPVITPPLAESSVGFEYPTRTFSVEVREVGTLRLVTAIEILSPAHKRPNHDAYEDYLKKRREILRSDVHLVEIDLRRAGTRPPLEEPVPYAPYYVMVSRVQRRPRVEVWPIQLQDKLPVLPIPLRDPDPDAPLDLGAMVATVYERGAYQALIEYAHPPRPPLTEAESQYIQDLLRPFRKHA